MVKFSKINGRKFNKALEMLTQDQYQLLTQKALPPANTNPQVFELKNCKSQVRNLIIQFDLDKIENYNLRAELFIIYCKYVNLSLGTTKVYFTNARSAGLFGNSTIKPNLTLFRNFSHYRLISQEQFLTYCKYLFENFDRDHAPMLFVVFTALRNFEVRQIDTKALYLLLKEEAVIPVIRKDTRRKKNKQNPIYWKPIYSTEFIKFLKEIRDLYKPEYNLFLNSNINSRLFQMSNKALIARTFGTFYKCCQTILPNGHGIQGLRNTFGREFVRMTKDISIIQKYFQHSSAETTKIYTQAHWQELAEGFNKFTPQYDIIAQQLNDKVENDLGKNKKPEKKRINLRPTE